MGRVICSLVFHLGRVSSMLNLQHLSFLRHMTWKIFEKFFGLILQFSCGKLTGKHQIKMRKLENSVLPVGAQTTGEVSVSYHRYLQVFMGISKNFPYFQRSV